MRQLLILIKKEFRQIFRNPTILAVIFVAPVLQLIILPLAANYEITHIKMAVVDHDHSTVSRDLIKDITSSDYFQLVYYGESFKEAIVSIEKGNADLILEIPANLEKKLVREGSQNVFLGINAIEGTKAGLASAYLGRIFQDYNQELQISLHPETEQMMESAGIETRTLLWFNPHYNYRLSLVPGILVFLVMLVAGMLSALNIVEEKEIGTIEQINVSPVKKHNFILGKMIPFFILAMITFTIGLLVSRFVFGIEIQGNLILLYFFIALFLVAVLGYGLLISTISNSQQQAMLINFFFVLIFILMSGLLTPIESMPQFAQYITYLNPMRYMISAIRLIMLKDSGFTDLLPQFIPLIMMAVIFNVAAILNYRKTN